MTARISAAIGLLAVASLHVAAAGDEDVRLVYWSFIALAAACVVAAAWVVLDGRRARALVLALAALPIAGYVLSRTIGLPGATDDIGEWADSLGIAALAVEAALVALAAQPARRWYPGPRSKNGGAPRAARSSSRSAAVAAESPSTTP
jgi:hypothetical protein